MKNRTRSAVGLLLAVCLVLSAPLDGAPRKKSSSRKRAVPSKPIASGSTLEQRLGSLFKNSVAVGSVSSLQVVEVDSGRPVAGRNTDLAVAPASNMKLFTTSAALDLLGPDFEFVTTVAMRGEVDPQGTLHGDIKIIGRGDPTIGGRFHDGNPTAVLERWATELKKAGVQTIEGDLLFEYGYFDTSYIHPTWPRDQLVNWYEAPVAALSMQEGTVLVRVLPGRPGGKAIVQLEPPNTYLALENTCVTRSSGRGLFITRRPGTNTILVGGNVRPKSGATEIYVAIVNPVHYFANVTNETFKREGIRLLGQVRLVERDTRPDWRTVTETRTPLSVVVYVINKKSQNQYAEQLLKTIGAEVKRDGSWAGGTAAVAEWLSLKVGVPPGQFRQVDGSGMSRENRTSSSAFISMLRYMWRTPNSRIFVSSMPYSGEPDSRLRRRLDGDGFARQVYAKTGYISGVIGLSGYVHAKSGRIYAFSFLFNKYRTGVWSVYRLQDEMLKEIVSGG